MFIATCVCWVSLGAIVYSYGVYPLLLAIVARMGRNRTPLSACSTAETNACDPDAALPFVSLIIAAYREEQVIGERLANALALDYPADRFEILIGVDGDLDRTGEIVHGCADDRIRCLQFPHRRGKASVLNDCVQAARGEILAFSDANTDWEPEALRLLVGHFADPQVGGVCGRLILTDAATGKNVDGAYWRYENWLKAREGQIGALLGVNGAIYAIRCEQFPVLPANTMIDDFQIGMHVHRQRKRLVYEKRARAHEETAMSVADEFKRRTRIGTGNFQSLSRLWRLLLPDYGVVSWAFWSHKVLRWFCPVFMVAAFVTAALLAEHPLYLGLLLGQSAFYLLAGLGSQPGLTSRWVKPVGGVARMAWMFVMMNVALGWGLLRWIAGNTHGTWQRTERSGTVGVPTSRAV